MILFYIAFYSFDGFDYLYENKTVLQRITRKTLLPSFEIPDFILEIKAGSELDSAFYYCSDRIGAISFAENSLISKLESYLFYKTSITSCDLSNCKKLIEISDNCFGHCYSLHTLVLPPNLEIIGYGSISYTLIQTLSLPSSITTIKGWKVDGSISSNEKLGNIIFGDDIKLTTIFSHSFMNNSLTEFYVPKNVVKIYSSPYFYNNITKINVHPENNHFITDEENITLFSNDKTIIYATAIGLEIPYTIPHTVEMIGSQAFRGSKFTSITFLSYNNMPFIIESFGDNVFGECINLREIIFPENVISIGHSTFAYCTNLATVKLNEKLETIQDQAFKSCISLREITIPAVT